MYNFEIFTSASKYGNKRKSKTRIFHIATYSIFCKRKLEYNVDPQYIIFQDEIRVIYGSNIIEIL